MKTLYLTDAEIQLIFEMAGVCFQEDIKLDYPPLIKKLREQYPQWSNKYTYLDWRK